MSVVVQAEQFDNPRAPDIQNHNHLMPVSVPDDFLYVGSVGS